MKEYQFVRIGSGDYDKIQLLYSTAFNQKESLQYIENKYDTSMFGLRDVGFLALTADGSPAAYYGVFPLRLCYRGSELSGAQSGDTMTSPAHQKKGLFTQLAKASYQLAEENGVKIVFGFPNENSYPGFKNKLAWQFTGRMNNYVIINNTLPFCELVYKYMALGHLYRAFVHKSLVQYLLPVNEENMRLLDTIESGVKKDLHFASYKMKSPDIYLLRYDGFTMFVKVSNHLQIGAVSLFEKTQSTAFIAAVKKLGKMLGCGKTILSLSNNHWLHACLQGCLPATEGMPVGFYTIAPGLELKEFAFCLADFDTF